MHGPNTTENSEAQAKKPLLKGFIHAGTTTCSTAIPAVYGEERVKYTYFLKIVS